MIGIYKIYNLISEKFYIGSAIDIKSRWRIHRHKLNKNKHVNKFLQSSWNLHSEEAFKFIMIEECSKEVLANREQFWLDATQCYNRNIGYNLNKIANSMLGFKHTEETKLKFKSRTYTAEQKANISKRQIGKKRPFKARPKGRIVSDKVKASVSQNHKGKILSEETKALISAANKGRKISPEAIAKREASKLRNKQEKLQNEYQ